MISSTTMMNNNNNTDRIRRLVLNYVFYCVIFSITILMPTLTQELLLLLLLNDICIKTIICPFFVWLIVVCSLFCMVDCCLCVRVRVLALALALCCSSVYPIRSEQYTKL